MQSYGERIAEFLAAEKVAMNRIRWRARNHPDYTEAVIRLANESIPRPRSYIILSSHIYFEPRKYKFGLFFGAERVLALDVDPRRYHRLSLRRDSINCTHWHFFGAEEELDARPLNHREWLAEFFGRARISYEFPYEAPIHDRVQLRLKL